MRVLTHRDAAVEAPTQARLNEAEINRIRDLSQARASDRHLNRESRHLMRVLRELATGARQERLRFLRLEQRVQHTGQHLQLCAPTDNHSVRPNNKTHPTGSEPCGDSLSERASISPPSSANENTSPLAAAAAARRRLLLAPLLALPPLPRCLDRLGLKVGPSAAPSGGRSSISQGDTTCVAGTSSMKPSSITSAVSRPGFRLGRFGGGATEAGDDDVEEEAEEESGGDSSFARLAAGSSVAALEFALSPLLLLLLPP